jgi:tripartite-type tricarboxylate transporter receptor subunit TctC
MRFRLLTLLAVASMACHAAAQDYPSKPVQLVIGFAPGGAVDLMGRAFARALEERGVKVVVENKPGAGGAIAFSQVVRAEPDGYVLAYGGITAGPLLMKSAPRHDALQPICQTHTVPMVVIVRADSPLKTMRQLIQQAKAEPGRIAYGTAGQGTHPHLLLEHFAKGADLQFTSVFYKGDAPMVVDLIEGSLPFGVSAAAAVVGKDKLRVLAAFSEQRLAAFPDAPTLKELGYTTLAPADIGLWAPKTVPATVVSAMARHCEAAVRSTVFREAARTSQNIPEYKTPSDYALYMAQKFAAVQKVVQDLNLKPQ